MKQTTLKMSLIAGLVVCVAAGPLSAGTFTCLSCTDEHPSWGMPRINSQGHVAMTRGADSYYGGPVYLWRGSWENIVPFPGCNLTNDNIKHPKLEFNDNGRIAFTCGAFCVGVGDTSGAIAMEPAPTTLGYAIDINDNDRIASFSWNAIYNNHIYTSDSPYTTYDDDVGPAEIIGFRVAYNNQNQIAWKPPQVSMLYRFTPGVGSEQIAVANFAPFDIDDRGRVIHMRDRERLMLDHMQLRLNGDMHPTTGSYGATRISDNGRYVLWTEYTDENWELWTLVDGIPTNLTQGNYNRVIAPDVNNDGVIVFQSIESYGVWPYNSHVYMYTSDEEEPVVYNGHFDGETLFGWDPVAGGAGTVELVAAGSGYAAQLTSGSPTSIGQLLDVPAAAATLAFDFDFVTANGTLTVSLDGVELAGLTSADDTEPGFTSKEIEITTTPPLGVEDALLLFSLDDASAATVRIDSIEVTEGGTGVADQVAGSGTLVLGSPSPNPFGSGTTMSLTLAKAGLVRAAVYSASGRLVRVLFDGHRSAGEGSLSWDGLDSTGEPVSSGVYFVRLSAGDEVRSGKVMMVR